MIDIIIPILETERLILRGPQQDDLDAQAAFFTSERSNAFGGPSDRSDVWRALLRGAGHWVIRGYGMWYIVDKQSGKTAGWAGIIHHIEWPEPELAWTVFDDFEGKSIAYEAATAARDYAYDHQGFGPLISLIDPANTRSIKLAERLGASLEGEATVMGGTNLVYRHLPPEPNMQARTLH